MTSVCTGALVYAAAGLLRDRPATTWWGALDTLAELDPTIEVRPDDRFVDSGEVVTAAGVSAGIDMALHLVARPPLRRARPRRPPLHPVRPRAAGLDGKPSLQERMTLVIAAPRRGSRFGRPPAAGGDTERGSAAAGGPLARLRSARRRRGARARRRRRA